MPLSKKKQEKAAKAKRIQYVVDRSYNGSATNPFLDANWNNAARRYIETGDETLKEHFPRHINERRRSKK